MLFLSITNHFTVLDFDRQSTEEWREYRRADRSEEVKAVLEQLEMT